MLYFRCSAVPYDNIRLSLDDWLHQFRYIRSSILIITIGIDNDICLSFKCSNHSFLKRACQADIFFIYKDMFYSILTRHPYCLIKASVVYYKQFNQIYTIDVSWYISNYPR